MASPKDRSHPVPAAHHLRARLRFRHLELLAALGESTSLHKASAVLSMTQPAASKLLREIEGMISVRLFDRSRTGVAPTPAGTVLIHHARLQLGLLDGMREEIVAIENGAAGQVRVGVAAVAAPVLLPKIHKLLASGAPGVALSIREGGPEMLGELRSGKLDCLLGRLVEGDEGADLDFEYLYDESIVVVARPGHPLLKRRGAISWSRAMEFEWILPPEGAPIRRALHVWFIRNRMRLPSTRLESLSVLANLAVVRDSDTLAFLPSRVAGHYERLGLLHVLPIDLPTSFPELPGVCLIRRRGEAARSSFDAFITSVRIAGRHAASLR